MGMVVLRSTTEALHERLDKIRALIGEVEAQFKAINAGVAGWVKLADGPSGSRHLGYSKLTNKWGLILKKTDENGEQMWRFNEAPIWLRLEAIPHLPSLITHLTERADDSSKLADKRITELEGFLETLQPPKEK